MAVRTCKCGGHLLDDGKSTTEFCGRCGSTVVLATRPLVSTPWSDMEPPPRGVQAGVLRGYAHTQGFRLQCHFEVPYDPERHSDWVDHHRERIRGYFKNAFKMVWEWDVVSVHFYGETGYHPNAGVYATTTHGETET